MFSSQRFTDDKGVSQPCQVRFIHYFEGFYRNIVISPQIKILKKIKLITIPSGGCKPFFQVYLTEGLAEATMKYENKNEKDQVRFYKADENVIELPLKDDLPLFGNIMVKFFTKGKISDADLFRVTFNTAFIKSDNIIKLSRYEISPEKVHSDFSKFPAEFEVILEFADFCKGDEEVKRPPCTSTTTEVENVCEKC